MFKVYDTPCANCLLSPDRIVSPARAREIIDNTVAEGSFFVCHKSSIEGGNVCCRGYFDKVGERSQRVMLAKRLDVVEFVPLPPCKSGFVPYRDTVTTDDLEQE